MSSLVSFKSKFDLEESVDAVDVDIIVGILSGLNVFTFENSDGPENRIPVMGIVDGKRYSG